MIRTLTQSILLLSATISIGQATTLFSGSGTSGTTQGQFWSVNADAGGDWGEDSWGMPGAATGPEFWLNDPANVLTFTFTLPVDEFIEPATPPVLVDATLGDSWTAVVSPDNLSVTFTAPGTDLLSNGDQFFVNVYFTSVYDPNDAVSTSGLSFNGSADGPAAAPEPASMALLGLGLLGLGLMGWRKSRSAGIVERREP